MVRGLSMVLSARALNSQVMHSIPVFNIGVIIAQIRIAAKSAQLAILLIL